MRDLARRRALITGGARGIGRAIALELAAERADIVLTDLVPEALERTVDEVGARGVRAEGWVADVTSPGSIAALRERVLAGGPLDILVNNAGVVFGGPFLDIPLDRHVTTLRVNVEGMVTMSHAFLEALLARPEAHIVNVASASGLLPLPNGTTYAASKWAAVGFSESLRAELREQGHRHVRVTTVCPSYVTTGLFEGARAPFLTPLLTAETLARKIVAAVRADRRWVREPWMVKLLPLLRGTLPGPAFDAIMRLFGVTRSMAGWRGRT